MDVLHKTEEEPTVMTPEGGLPASPLDRPAPAQSTSRARLAVALVLGLAMGVLGASTSRTLINCLDSSAEGVDPAGGFMLL